MSCPKVSERNSLIFVCKNVPSSTEQFTYVNNEKNLMWQNYFVNADKVTCVMCKDLVQVVDDTKKSNPDSKEEDVRHS
jgi:hypothetical protein